MIRYSNFFRRKNVNGILLLDKPKNISSTGLLNRIKSLFFVKKLGHAGTLDPLATGMLPICFGKSTKFVRYLLNFNKQYNVVACLGKRTDTFDINGKVVGVCSVQLSINQIKRSLEFFLGKLFQVPPMFSSLKFRGIPLYYFARKGIEIFRSPRQIYVYQIELISWNKDNLIELNIFCSKGTYIRSIINDLGIFLGCGACVVELRRLKVGYYLPSSMIKISTLENIFFDKNLNDLEVLEKLDSYLISTDVIMEVISDCV